MCLKNQEIPGYVLLENGTFLRGYLFGADIEAHGEVGKTNL